MKTRQEIIDEILTQYNRLNPIHQAMTLKFALKTMQDAMLFQLAQDLNIDVLAAVQS